MIFTWTSISSSSSSSSPVRLLFFWPGRRRGDSLMGGLCAFPLLPSVWLPGINTGGRVTWATESCCGELLGGSEGRLIQTKLVILIQLVKVKPSRTQNSPQWNSQSIPLSCLKCTYTTLSTFKIFTNYLYILSTILLIVTFRNWKEGWNKLACIRWLSLTSSL